MYYVPPRAFRCTSVTVAMTFNHWHWSTEKCVPIEGCLPHSNSLVIFFSVYNYHFKYNIKKLHFCHCVESKVTEISFHGVPWEFNLMCAEKVREILRWNICQMQKEIFQMLFFSDRKERKRKSITNMLYKYKWFNGLEDEVLNNFNLTKNFLVIHDL